MSVGIYSNYIDQFPAGVQSSEDWTLFAALLDAFDVDIRDSITLLGDVYDVEKCPETLLEDIGYFYGAPIFKGDSDRIKRQKVANAIARHRVKGLRSNVTEMVEKVTGITPDFINFGSTYSAFFIWESQNHLMPAPNNFAKWASENNVSYGGAMWGSIAGSGMLERFVIYMDIKIANPATSLLDKVENTVKYFGAAYFRWFIGYSSPGWVTFRQVY